jgi:hypothetical protein
MAVAGAAGVTGPTSGSSGISHHTAAVDVMTRLARLTSAGVHIDVPDSWDMLVLSLAELGQEKLREGLIKDEAGNDVALSPRTEQELVDYEGMLVSGAVAQRRG